MVQIQEELRRLGGQPVVLGNACVASAYLGRRTEGLPSSWPDADLVDIAIADGRIASITPAGTHTSSLDLGGRLVWPRLVDMHTHLEDRKSTRLNSSH